MMRLRSVAMRLLIAAAMLALMPGLVRSALAQAGLRVSEIAFSGNRRFDADTLRLSLRTKVGQPLDESLLNEDVRTLYEFFATVQVAKHQKGDEVGIEFVVTENEIVSDVILRGVSELTETEVRAVMDTAKGRPLAEFRIQNDARKIERLYRIKGHHFVQVRTNVTDTPEGKSVAFQVLEGPRVQVGSITFVGNDAIPRGRLLEVMQLQESGFLGLGAAEFVEETLIRDRASLLRLYHVEEGYLDAEVEIEDVAFSEDRRKAAITIRIREGAPYLVRKIEFKGVERYPGGADALRKQIAVREGRRLRIVDVRKALDQIESAYHDQGFFAIDVDYQPKAADGMVDVTFVVDEQSKARVRKLVILGNEITQDRVIRRELPVYPGEVLNMNDVEKGKRRLQALGYFSRVETQVLNPPAGEDPALRDVVYQVDDDAKTGQVRFAVGASSDSGLLGSFVVTKRNFDWRDWPEHFGDVFSGRAFTGAGQVFQLELSPGTVYSNYQLAFTEPWMFDKPITFGWDLFFRKTSRFDYDVDRKGIDLTLGRRFHNEGLGKLDTVFGISGETRIEEFDLTNLDDSSAPTAFLARGSNSLISERLTFRIERTDIPAAPTQGWSAQYSPEVGFLGDVRLFKNELELRDFNTLWTTEDERRHTLTLGAHAGYAQPLGSSVRANPNLFGTEYVPTYEHYFAGGTSDFQVRGFAFGGAGPHGQGSPLLARERGESRRQRNIRLAETARSVLENDGDALGGDLAIVANAEYGFPLYENILGGVLFFDSGMTRDSLSSSHGLSRSQFDRLQNQLQQGGPRQKQLARRLEFDDGGSFWDDWRASVGVGLRIRIPFLGDAPIALDFGFPVRKRRGDDTQVLSFSIQKNF